MKVTKLVVGELEANCFIVEAPEQTAIVIDPGAEAEVIAAELESRGLTLRKILLTHGHFDHMGAAKELKDRYNAQVYISGADEELLHDREKSVAFFLPEQPFHPVEPDARVKDGDVISQGSMKIKVMATPGHTAGSVCFIAEDCIFTGDTLFHGSVGRTDLYSGNIRQQSESLQKLLALDKNYRLYCGHGEDTDLDTERKTNPFLAAL